MSPELNRAAWRNHQHANTKFLRPTPRTAREAFGTGMPHHRHGNGDGIILAIALIGLILAVVLP